MRFVLASQSPRRRWLLASVGLEFDVRPADVDETPHPGEAPDAYAARVALDKARAVEAEVVLAADTVVALDGTILTKAWSEPEAIAMLRRLSGRTHYVHTAVALVAAGIEHETIVTTEVRFRTLGDAEIRRYVASGEPMDKAGAYGIQGDGGALVAEVRGSYTNVVGLPLEETLALLEKVRA
jgi:septum formation protein